MSAFSERERALLDGPPAHEGSRSIVWLDEIECHDPFLVGGKAASLSRLAEHYPVPPGFSLTTAAFDRASVGASVETGQLILPPNLHAEVREPYHQLGALCEMENPAVAVRSSAVDEDGTDAAFAGQHETFLNVVGVDAVVYAVRNC